MCKNVTHSQPGSCVLLGPALFSSCPLALFSVPSFSCDLWSPVPGGFLGCKPLARPMPQCNSPPTALTHTSSSRSCYAILHIGHINVYTVCIHNTCIRFRPGPALLLRHAIYRAHKGICVYNIHDTCIRFHPGPALLLRHTLPRPRARALRVLAGFDDGREAPVI